ncbi:MAG: STAS domain-containing protein [Cytophagales bacterium]|nr:STAS domain-containing protein [Armatimonadota bacterium]
MNEKIRETVARHQDLGSVSSPASAVTALPESDPLMANLLEDDGLLNMMEAEGTLIVSGDIDLHQAPEFRARAETFIQDNAQPRMDLSQVPFLDSAGLAALLSLSRTAKAQDKSLRLIVTGSPRRVLRITGIDRVLILED